jgi:serine/threonine-protein kinase
LQGRYRILQVLASGGRGTVYLAEHVTLGERVAVKEILEALLADPQERAEAVQLFQNEARVLARLRHPHLPRVTDFFEESGRHYLVMDVVEGETVEDILARTTAPFPESQVISWAIQICDVLTYLHSQNPPVIFRDLKPGNVMIDRQGQVKLIDFGIARMFNPAKGTDTLKMGTPGYAPPEQYGGKGGTDPRSDLYALGALMHHLVTLRDPTNEPPFYFPTAPARRLNPAVSAQLEALIAKATEYERGRRFGSAVEMRMALQACLLPSLLRTAPSLPVPSPHVTRSVAQSPVMTPATPKLASSSAQMTSSPSHVGSAYSAPPPAKKSAARSRMVATVIFLCSTGLLLGSLMVFSLDGMAGVILLSLSALGMFVAIATVATS